jgi:hypothetical protein
MKSFYVKSKLKKNEFRLQDLGVRGKSLKGHYISARGNAPGMGSK